MKNEALIAVEKWTSLIVAALLLASLVLLSRHDMFSLAVGGALAVGNAWVIRRVAENAGPALSGKPGLLVALFNIKLGILAVLIFVSLRYLHVAPVPFLVGISVLPVAILVVALRRQLTPPSDVDKETHG